MATITQTKHLHPVEGVDIDEVVVVDPGGPGFAVNVCYTWYEADGVDGAKTATTHEKDTRSLATTKTDLGAAIFVAAGVDPTPKTEAEKDAAVDSLRTSIVNALNSELGF